MNNLFHVGNGTFIMMVESMSMYNGGSTKTLFKGNINIISKVFVGSSPFSSARVDASPISFPFHSNVSYDY
jgi:hypothetical protein